MTKYSRSLLLATVIYFPACLAGCSSEKPTTVEVTDEVLNLYEEDDKLFQKHAGDAYDK